MCRHRAVRNFVTVSALLRFLRIVMQHTAPRLRINRHLVLSAPRVEKKPYIRVSAPVEASVVRITWGHYRDGRVVNSGGRLVEHALRSCREINSVATLVSFARARK